MSHVNFVCVCGGDIDTTLEKQQQREEYAKPILNGRIIQLLWEAQEYLLTVRQTSCLLRDYQWSPLHQQIPKSPSFGSHSFQK